MPTKYLADNLNTIKLLAGYYDLFMIEIQHSVLRVEIVMHHIH
jgi:hypothetical protein